MAGFANRFGKHKWWIVTALLTAPLVALAAGGVPNVFAPNTVISSAQVNANFQSLSDRITALESAKTTINMVMDNKTGSLSGTGITANVTTGGGSLTLIVSGTGYIAGTAGGALDVAVTFDGTIIGHLKATTNEGGSHKSLPTRAFLVTPTPAAGSHVIGMLYGTGTNTTSDVNDYFSVTSVETH
jgi:hypothetical protein